MKIVLAIYSRNNSILQIDKTLKKMGHDVKVVYTDEYTRSISEDINSIIDEFEGTDFFSISKEEYDKLRDKLTYAVEFVQGIVDEYVLVFLKELKKEMHTIVFISNGAVEIESKKKVEQLGIIVWERENVGFDIEGHKYVLQHYGYDKLREFDEIVMTNSTIAGPLYPFSEMFDTMAQRDLDFWGITMHHGETYDPWNLIEYGYIPPHVQSFFIAIRKSMFSPIP